MSREKWQENVRWANNSTTPSNFVEGILWADSRIKELDDLLNNMRNIDLMQKQLLSEKIIRIEQLEDAVSWAAMQGWTDVDADGNVINRYLKITKDELLRRAGMEGGDA
jgi:hypothetical protein